MPEDPDALARLVNETRRNFADAYERPSDVAPWEQRHPRQQALDREIAAAVEAAVRERVAADLKRLAADLTRHALVSPGVPGIEREARRDAYLAAAQVAVHGLTPQERDEDKEAGHA